MNSNRQAQQDQVGEKMPTSVDPADFDRWAVAVRRQLLASLQKRSSRQS